MPDPQNPGKQTGRKINVLSDEAQHVVNALEAHFNAVKEAAKHGTPGLVENVKTLGNSVLDRLEAWGAQFAGHEQARKSLSSDTDVVQTAPSSPAGRGIGGGKSAGIPPSAGAGYGGQAGQPVDEDT